MATVIKRLGMRKSNGAAKQSRLARNFFDSEEEEEEEEEWEPVIKKYPTRLMCQKVKLEYNGDNSAPHFCYLLSVLSLFMSNLYNLS